MLPMKMWSAQSVDTAIQALCKEGTRVATPGKEPRSKSCVSDNTNFSFMFQLFSTLRTRQNVSAVASSKMHSIRMRFHAMVSFLIQKTASKMTAAGVVVSMLIYVNIFGYLCTYVYLYMYRYAYRNICLCM